MLRIYFDPASLIQNSESNGDGFDDTEVDRNNREKSPGSTAKISTMPYKSSDQVEVNSSDLENDSHPIPTAKDRPSSSPKADAGEDYKPLTAEAAEEWDIEDLSWLNYQALNRYERVQKKLFALPIGLSRQQVGGLDALEQSRQTHDKLWLLACESADLWTSACSMVHTLRDCVEFDRRRKVPENCVPGEYAAAVNKLFREHKIYEKKIPALEKKLREIIFGDRIYEESGEESSQKPNAVVIQCRPGLVRTPVLDEYHDKCQTFQEEISTSKDNLQELLGKVFKELCALVVGLKMEECETAETAKRVLAWTHDIESSEAECPHTLRTDLEMKQAGLCQESQEIRDITAAAGKLLADVQKLCLRTASYLKPPVLTKDGTPDPPDPTHDGVADDALSCWPLVPLLDLESASDDLMID
ncbi:hypothetical protein F5Y08DRAFT_136017 [Xylaria arbuscula]|nr:hypothetical protein F5Y08DRAFT_136017 [Xylaria arbuscula]